jgi:hypothetical protein
MELVRQKNVATIIIFPLVDADGDPVVSSGNPDSEIDVWTDGAAPDGFADCTNEAIEIGTTGSYYLSLTQSECNVDYAIIQIKSDNAKTQWVLIRFMVGDPLNLATTNDGGTINVASGIVEANVQEWLDTIVPTPNVAGRPVVSGGYEGGAVWINTLISNTNTTDHVDGTIENPVSTVAAATTIAASLGLKKFNLMPGSSITLAQAYDNYIFDACHATIALGGFSVNNSVFIGAVITGNDDGSNASHTQYFDCVFTNSALGQFVFTRCYFMGTITLAEAGSYFMHQCFSGVAGASTPTLDFGSGLAASQVSMRDYSGGVEIEYMGAGGGTYNLSLEGQGQLVINANCSATSNVMLRGDFDLTDNSGGTVTVDRDDDSANIIDIQSRIPASLISGKMDADATSISGDSGAADNLESQYDTTGLSGGTFPATQDQLSGIANVGAAVNTPADSYTLTTGTQSSGTVASTQALDGTNHEHTDDAGVMDLYYEFVIGSGVPTTVIVTGYLNGNNDDLEVYGYDWVAAGWVQIGELNGKNASSNEVNSYNLFINMVGNGANEGLVRIRFTDGAFTLTTATLAIDQIFVSFSRGVEGYDNGAIWIDTTLSNENTVVGVDGTSRNPVSTIAAANTLSASTNLNRFEIAPGSSITFAASQDNQVFNGENWTLALGSQSISSTHIIGANVSGICTGASPPSFERCHVGAITIPPCHLEESSLEGTITIGSAGDFSFGGCESNVPGSGTPALDFGGALNSSQVGFRDYSGGIEIQNMGAGSGTYRMTLEGDGQLVINANCSVTSTLELRGDFRVTDNASGAVVVTRDDDSANIILTLADTDEMQVKLPTNNIMGSSVVSDKDGEIDAIKTVTDLLPDAGALDDLAAILADTVLVDKWLKNKLGFSGSDLVLYDDNGVDILLTWTLSQGTLGVSGPYDRAKAT